ncbi:chemosensory pili system protein ChpA (sensor histidine kinase/response regulator) [Lysobacter niabensis]|uniref:histidine kinase n=1 Tax=Agrilutibacter niabensis TaxID=380628 RepID=A0ABU1VK80_9GAMM|nr:Hpt domain-containing protein [Lysobacter niabensis]MDR7097891.1 chemosensory pili system protein ChpA (sensor histidine kinase/response regulator) [Lysobacter niabensis]
MTVLRDAIDTTTLGWVKPELDATLRLARDEIESFAENPSQTAHMRTCAGYMHQVHGTLRMIELYAPAMVAEEMERLALSLLRGEVSERDDACAALMRGVVQLPDYLERLQGGHRDIPIVLLPLLNELRATRGETGLNESVLFSPDLDRPLPENIPAPASSAPKPARDELVTHLGALRDALAAWPEDGAPADASQLATTIESLLAQVETEPLRRMLWVASSVADALRDGALNASRGMRQAFAGVEREARQTLIEDSFAFGAPRTDAAAEPTRQLLYHVAHSQGQHPALASLRQTFDLAGQLPSEDELEHARGSLSGRNRALLDTVSAAIKEDLLRVKDALDLHLRTRQTDVTELREQVDALTRVSDTLGMMGLGVARNVVMQQRDAMREIVAGHRAADEGALLDVAGALLYVDASLDDQVARLGRPDAAGDEDLVSGEHNKVIDVVVREAIANFGDARQSFVAFVETGWDHAELGEVPRLLDEVGGALRMLEQQLPADYLVAVKRYVDVELITRKRVPNSQQLDTMADALASLEYYLEALRDQRPGRDEILEIARHALERLRYWPLPALEEVGAPLTTAEALQLSPDLADALDFGKIEPFRGLAHSSPVETTAATPAHGAVEATVDVAAVSAPAPVAASADAVAAGGFERSDDIDDEIREVFLEELQEEIANLGELLKPWRDNPEDAERLRPIRRVFHTLKGSGRLVGAKTLGEFSWKVENMLNRVLDGTRPASPAVVALVGQAHDTLPQLHAALRGEAAITADLSGMEAVADRLAAGEEAFFTPAAPAPVVEAIPELAEAAVVSIDLGELGGELNEAVFEEPAATTPAATEMVIPGVPASVDAVLLEILAGEVGGHLVTIEDWLEAARQGPQPATESLQRAVHTLNGAFAMTEVPVITEITGPTETYIKRLLAAGVVPANEGVAAMGDVAAAIRGTMQGLQAPIAHVPRFEGLAARMQALRDSLPEARHHQVEEEEAHEAELTSFDLSEFTDLAVDLGTGGLVQSMPAASLTAAALDAGSFEAGHGDVALEEVEAFTIDDFDAVADNSLNLQLEAAQLEVERVEAERLETERFEAERFEAERLEAERLEAERLEAERLEAERLEAERLEAERLEAERLEAERLEAERLEAERLEAEPALAEGGEGGEGSEAERVEAERAEAERAEAERAEAERAEAERAEAERAEAERAEAERAEAERVAAEEEAEYARLEVEYAEAQRLAQAQREAAEAERIAAEQAEAERIAAELAAAEEVQRTEAQRLADEERLEAERLAVEQAAAAQAAAEAEAEAVRRAEEVREAEAQAQRDAAAAAAALAAASTLPEPEPAVAAILAQAQAGGEDPDEALDLTGLDPELVDIFVEEGADLLDHSDGLLAELRVAPDSREPLIGLQRDLHTLKGGARMAGIMAVGELGHTMESLLESVVENRVELGSDGVPLLERGFDRLHAMVTRVGARQAIAMPEALIAEFDARSRGQRLATSTDEVTGTPQRAAAPALELKPLSAPMVDAAQVDDDDIAARAPQEQVRIRADLLDRLVNYAGEVAIYRARLEQQLGAFRGAIAEMDQTNIRMRDQLRRLEIETEAQIMARYQRENETPDATFDPLELDRFSTLQQLSRALAESAADQTSLQTTLDDLTRQYETLLLQQSRVSSELQEGLMRTRMVPFDALVPRLRRVVRQASGELGKNVQLKLGNAQGELDRNVLERMTAPLEHMLRNAVAHGLEKPDKRKKAGKAEEGSISIAIRREGSEVVLEVADDGAGLNRDAIRKRGEERGLVRSDAVLSNSDLDMLIFEPGFSTADEVSRLAGRGVGMDVVASEVRQLGGTIDIDSKPGEGTRFTLRLPQTLAVTQAVFVRIGETSFAVPIASVRGVGRIPRDQLAQADAVYQYGGEDYPVHDLGNLVGHATAKAEGQLQMPLLLIRAGDLRAAVSVDHVIGNREIVVKPVGPQVASVPGIFGATIMGDGSVVVILDVAPLVRRQAVLAPERLPVAPVVETRRVPMVMVVDDSVTMRKVTGRVLERNNFEVLTAKDGLDALEKMVEHVPDLMLLDIEMPRMDGYELATAMKSDPRLRNVPIVMITSRTGEKHRQRAFDIGVNRYLGKPYQEPELLRNVFELLGVKRGHE